VSEIGRVRYFDGQVLRTDEFADEQAYHVATRRRHNLSHHEWGIAVGLELTYDAQDATLYVEPGYAVDGYGRELVLPQRRPLPSSAFADKASDDLEVSLAYDRVGTNAAPPGYAGCDSAGDVFYRWTERPLVFLQVPDPAFTDRRRPQGVPAGDTPFAPWRTPPEDGWFPVYLGTISKPQKPDGPPAIDLTGRPYIGLVAETIAAPSGDSVLQLGPVDEGDPNVVAVYVRPSDPTVDWTVPRLAIAGDGSISLVGDTTLNGDLKLVGALDLEPGTTRGAAASPYRMYHVHDAQQDLHEVRIEMAGPAGGAGGTNEVVIGAWKKAADDTGKEVEAFHPCLTVDDRCNVTVHGNLVVRGALQTRAGSAATVLSDRAAEFVSASYLSGVGGGGGLLSRFYHSPAGEQAEARMLAAHLAAAPGQADALVRVLREEHPHVLDLLRESLDEVDA
jgi:hypothetical protein